MKRRPRSLTEEERSLWRQVAATTNRRAGPIVAPPPDPRDIGETAIPAPPDPTTGYSATRGSLERIVKPHGRPAPGLTLPSTPPSPSSGLDRRTQTRLRKGKRDPDARIDLHGMTATRAHGALTRFIQDSRAAGLRCVLVITGKGAAGSARAFGDPLPGVIRREAPHWLSTPPLSSMIVNVSQAHPKHGGGGALYVYLKKIR